ncbi:MAG: hypothetical protein KAJ33_06095 [Thermoplasmata archaeon]|nr:hypothetical protein [Thermoplasmata archaeon]
MPPILTPTLDTEIAAKLTEIAAEEVHTTRTAYVAAVAPLKAQLKNLVEQNKAIITANAVRKEEYVPIPTQEEIDKEINADVAIDYPLPDQMALNWKVQTGELTMESPEIVAFIARVDEAKAKYPKV